VACPVLPSAASSVGCDWVWAGSAIFAATGGSETGSECAATGGSETLFDVDDAIGCITLFTVKLYPPCQQDRQLEPRHLNAKKAKERARDLLRISFLQWNSGIDAVFRFPILWLKKPASSWHNLR
jgi:hypothetical protein